MQIFTGQLKLANTFKIDETFKPNCWNTARHQCISWDMPVKYGGNWSLRNKNFWYFYERQTDWNW